MGVFGLEEGGLSLVYLAMPFGWNGAPAQFAVFGGPLTMIHCPMVYPIPIGRSLPTFAIPVFG